MNVHYRTPHQYLKRNLEPGYTKRDSTPLHKYKKQKDIIFSVAQVSPSPALSEASIHSNDKEWSRTFYYSQKSLLLSDL